MTHVRTDHPRLPRARRRVPHSLPGGRPNRRFAAGALLIAALLLAAKVLGPHPALSADAEDVASPAIMQALESASAADAAAVGPGAGHLVPIISGPVLQGPSGRPWVIYMGAEFCPYCAAQRWPLIVALSRFGRFQGLRLSHSAAGGAFSELPTFTFHGASYQSTSVEFTGVETGSNVRVNGQWAPLDTPSADVARVAAQYNAPPYVDGAVRGTIPWIDVANRFVFSGSSFNPTWLMGLTQASIAARLSDPSSEMTRAILGEANVMTAAICVATANAPSAACDVPAIQSIVRELSTAH